MDEGGRAPLELVGRDEVVAAASSGIENAAGVLIVGAPGVGKTALLRFLLEAEARRGPTRVLRLAAGASGPAIPFGAFAPHVRDVPGVPAAQPDPFYLLQSIRESVVAGAQGERLVIGVDDAHRLDEASATLLFQLVSADEAVVVVSARSGEPLPDPVSALWKEGLVDRVDLSPLDDEGTVALAEKLVGGPLGGDLAEALSTASGGNPLYARELLIAGFDGGRIAERYGVWCLSGSLPIGPRLTELLDEKLRELPEGLIRSLEVIAFADPLPLDVMRSVVAPGDSDALQRLGFLSIDTPDGDSFARPGHPLYGELVRSRITAARTNELCLMLAEAFEVQGRVESDLLRVVTWRLDANRPPPPETLLEASLGAAERLDWQLSARLAKAAMDGGAESAAFVLAEALGQLGRFSEALTVLDGREGASAGERARVAVLRSSVLFWGQGRFDDAVESLAVAEEHIDSPDERAWVRAIRAGMLTALGHPSRGVEVARAVLKTPHLSERAADAATSALAQGLVWSGRCEMALALAQTSLDRGLERYGSVPLAGRWPAAVKLAGYRLGCHSDEMLDFAPEEYQLAVHLRNRQGKAAAASALGWAAMMKGDLALSVLHLREALSSLEGRDASAGRGQALVTLAEAVALAGDSAAADEVLAEARQDMFAAPDWARPRLHWCAAWAAASRGELSMAQEELETAAGEARRTGQTSFELLAIAALTRLGSPTELDRLARLTTWVEGPYARILSAHAQARASGSGEGLEGVSESYEDLGATLYAAEAAAQASRLHRAAGEPRRATAAALRAQSLLPDSDSARPLTVMLATSPASLTRREREVALLARSGLPSQEIASRLHLSVRTVETHLARVYYKLGITKRAELTDALDGDAEVAPAVNE